MTHSRPLTYVVSLAVQPRIFPSSLSLPRRAAQLAGQVLPGIVLAPKKLLILMRTKRRVGMHAIVKLKAFPLSSLTLLMMGFNALHSSQRPVFLPIYTYATFHPVLLLIIRSHHSNIRTNPSKWCRLSVPRALATPMRWHEIDVRRRPRNLLVLRPISDKVRWRCTHM